MADFNKKIEIEVDVKSANKSLNQLEAEVRDLNKELDKVGLDNKQVNNIKNNLAKIEAATETTKAASKEFKDSLVEATVRITQAFVTTTGTLLSFAQTEEDAAATTAKLAQAMAIADSIEQVYNATKAIGEVRTKALALAETEKTAATVAGTVATEGAAVATGVLATAIQFMLGPIGLVILGITALTGLYFLFRKTAADTAKEQNKLNDSVKEFSDATTEASKAQLDLNRSNIKDNIENQRQAIKDSQKAAKDDKIFLLNQEKKFIADLEQLRKDGAAFNSEEVKAVEKNLFEVRTKQKANQAEINNIKKQGSDFEIDVATAAKNQILDLQLEQLSTFQDLDSKKKALDLDYAKQVNELNARIAKGDSTANGDALIAYQTYINDKIALNNEALDIELTKRNEVTDKELQDLSLIDTKTARFQEIELNRQKAIDEYNTAISKGEIKSAEELARINNDAKTQTLALLKEIQNETKTIGDETKNISLDLLVSDLNKITEDIGADKENQLKAIAETTKSDLEKLDEEYAASLEKLGTITTDEQKDQAKKLKENYDVKVKVIKKGEADATKVVEENTELRVFAEKSAQQDILEISTRTLQKILSNEKLALDVRIKANQELIDIQLKRIALNEEEELRLAEIAKKTPKQIEAIKAKYKDLKAAVIEVGKETEKSLILNDFTKKIETAQRALTKLSEIKVFGEQAGINNFLNTINGLAKGLNGALDIFKKFKQGVLTPEDVAAFASSLVDITSSIVQTAFQQNIDNFNKQLEQLNEKKAEIEEDLQNSADKIKELQGNLAQANIEDRNRIIKLIDKERQREKALADQKKKAALEEKKLQEQIKEEKRKAFQAQKAASIIQATISTALGVLAPWGNPLTLAAAPFISAAIATLGAAQVAIIASQPVPEFFEGGHTERGNSKEVAGVVHKNEWVAPAWMVESPKYRNNIQELEAARKGGFATGGFTSTEQNQSVDALNRTILSVEALANRPVVVSVQEINSVSNTVIKTKAKATL